MEETINKPETIKYDPNKMYHWHPNSRFIIEGGEFGAVLNSLREILNSPEARKVFLAERAHRIIEGSLAKAVEAGFATEVKNEASK